MPGTPLIRRRGRKTRERSNSTPRLASVFEHTWLSYLTLLHAFRLHTPVVFRIFELGLF